MHCHLCSYITVAINYKSSLSTYKILISSKNVATEFQLNIGSQHNKILHANKPSVTTEEKFLFLQLFQIHIGIDLNFDTCWQAIDKGTDYKISTPFNYFISQLQFTQQGKEENQFSIENLGKVAISKTSPNTHIGKHCFDF